MLAKILEDGKVCLQYGRDPTEFFRLGLKASDVDSQIEIQRSANLYHLMSMMEILHSLFESDGYEQTNDDGCNMDEEVFPSVDRLVGSVNMSHPSHSSGPP